MVADAGETEDALLPYEDIEAWLERCGRSRAGAPSGDEAAECSSSAGVWLAEKLEAFAAANAVPAKSANYKREAADELAPLLELVGSVVEDHALLFNALTCLKILSRKQQNRRAMGVEGFRKIASCADFVKNVPTLAAECANVILNFCYEKRNVGLFVSCGGAGLLAEYLESEDVRVQANAAGAIQSISFHPEGRAELREAGEGVCLPKIIGLLSSKDAKVRTRSVGALHNLSSDPGTIQTIRREAGLDQLVNLLRDESQAVAASAAGALQNVSREVASRKIIRNSEAVMLLADLLCCHNVQCQVCAAGALMNVLGPEVSPHPHSKHRRAFSKLVSQCLTLGMIYNAILDPTSSNAGRQVV